MLTCMLTTKGAKNWTLRDTGAYQSCWGDKITQNNRKKFSLETFVCNKLGAVTLSPTKDSTVRENILSNAALKPKSTETEPQLSAVRRLWPEQELLYTDTCSKTRLKLDLFFYSLGDSFTTFDKRQCRNVSIITQTQGGWAILCLKVNEILKTC